MAAPENRRDYLGHVRERIADKFHFADMPLESLALVVEALCRGAHARQGYDRAVYGCADSTMILPRPRRIR